MRKLIVGLFSVLLLIVVAFLVLVLRVKDVVVEQDKSDLVFISDQDREYVISEIKRSKSPKQLDKNLSFAIFDTFDKYRNTYPNLHVPMGSEFLSDDPKNILVTFQDGTKVNLLDGLGIESVKDYDMEKLREFSTLFISEYFKYPVNWFRYATPPVVVFVKSLDINSEVIAGAETGAIIYNINTLSNLDFSRRVVHHEIMHWVEQSTGSEMDVSWPVGKYTYKYDLTSEENHTLHPKEGFITGYSTTNVQEDKAEIYSYLFTKGFAKTITDISKNDRKLYEKVLYIKKFCRMRVGKMDDSYFDKIAN